MRVVGGEKAASAVITTTKETTKVTQTERGSQGFTKQGFSLAKEAVSGMAVSFTATERCTETPPAALVPESAVAKSFMALTTSGGSNGYEAEVAEAVISCSPPTKTGEQGCVRRSAPTTTKKIVCCCVFLTGSDAKQKGLASVSFRCSSVPV